MYKICEKCGYMYEDTGNGCPQCRSNASDNNNQENLNSANNSYTNNQSFDPFSISGTTVKSSDKASDGIDIKKFAIIIAAVFIPLILIVVCALVIPPLLKDNGNKPVVDDFDAGDNSYISDMDESFGVYMPSCYDWTMYQVEEYFSSIDCEIEYEYSYDSDVSVDCVIEQSLEPGEKINPGCTIVMEISKGEDNCPFEYQQKIVVSGSSNSSNASMELFVWENGEWVSQYSCFATVGKNGVGHNYGEGKGVTPAGTFKLGVVLSERKISNDTWPNKIVSEDTCIVDDTSSSYYNTIMNISDLPSNVGYDDIGNTIVNGNSDKVMYIEHNGNGIDNDDVVPGNGSAITICGKTSDLYATAGCIDISDDNFNSILSLLDYSMNPHIEITI